MSSSLRSIRLTLSSSLGRRSLSVPLASAAARRQRRRSEGTAESSSSASASKKPGGGGHRRGGVKRRRSDGDHTSVDAGARDDDAENRNPQGGTQEGGDQPAEKKKTTAPSSPVPRQQTGRGCKHSLSPSELKRQKRKKEKNRQRGNGGGVGGSGRKKQKNVPKESSSSKAKSTSSLPPSSSKAGTGRAVPVKASPSTLAAVHSSSSVASSPSPLQSADVSSQPTGDDDLGKIGGAEAAHGKAEEERTVGVAKATSKAKEEESAVSPGRGSKVAIAEAVTTLPRPTSADNITGGSPDGESNDRVGGVAAIAAGTPAAAASPSTSAVRTSVQGFYHTTDCASSTSAGLRPLPPAAGRPTPGTDEKAAVEPKAPTATIRDGKKAEEGGGEVCKVSERVAGEGADANAVIAADIEPNDEVSMAGESHHCSCLTCGVPLSRSISSLLDEPDGGEGDDEDEEGEPSSASKSLYLMSPHPLLRTPGCAVCSNRALAVEREALETTLATARAKDGFDNVDACSWCGRRVSEEDDESDSYGQNGPSSPSLTGSREVLNAEELMDDPCDDSASNMMQSSDSPQSVSITSQTHRRSGRAEDNMKEFEESANSLLLVDDSGVSEEEAEEDEADVEGLSACVSALYLCDSCPRSFCLRCIALSRRPEIWDQQRSTEHWHSHEEEVRRDIDGSEEWVCVHCNPPQALRSLVVSRGGDNQKDEVNGLFRNNATSSHCNHQLLHWESAKENERASAESTDGDKIAAAANAGVKFGRGSDPIKGDGVRVAKLLSLLTRYEDNLDSCQEALSPHGLQEKETEMREEIQRELHNRAVLDGDSGQFPSPALLCEMKAYRRLWEDHCVRITEAIPVVQEALEAVGVSLEAFYKYRKEEASKQKNVLKSRQDLSTRKTEMDENGATVSDCDENEAEARREAEVYMNQRDLKEGFRDGCRGASGYQARNGHIYDLDPPCNTDDEEDDLNSIDSDTMQSFLVVEDLQTLDEACDMPFSRTSNAWVDNDAPRCNPVTSSAQYQKLFAKALKAENAKWDKAIGRNKSQVSKLPRVESDDVKEEEMAAEHSGIFQAAVNIRRSRQKATQKGWTDPRSHHDLSFEAKTKKRVTTSLVDSPGKKIASEPQSSLPDSSSSICFENSSFILNPDDSKETSRKGPEKKTSHYTEGQVAIAKQLADVLKPHQRDGIKFMWDNICVSVSHLRKHPPAMHGESQHKENAGAKDENDQQCTVVENKVQGCVLAHNMGLGKSVQAVSLIHALLAHPTLTRQGPNNERIFRRVLLLVPVNTLANWENEFEHWLGEARTKEATPIRLHFPNKTGKGPERIRVVNDWVVEGGVMLASFQIFRSLAAMATGKKTGKGSSDAVESPEDLVSSFLSQALLSPGPDLVVVDEAHQALKKSSTGISKKLHQMKTTRRIALTGTPFQNNLFEYFCMANWVQPGLLGTEANFEHEFIDPIMNGIRADSSFDQVTLQQSRAKDLFTRLSPFVHRRDSKILSNELPFMQQAVLVVRQSKAQGMLYRAYKKYQKKTESSNFFEAYSKLRPVFNHPGCLLLQRHQIHQPVGDTPPETAPQEIGGPAVPGSGSSATQPRGGSTSNAIELLDSDEEADCKLDVSQHTQKSMKKKGVGIPTNCSPVWWHAAQKKYPRMDEVKHGGKIVLLLQILAHADMIGDKVVVFSQCLKTLDYIEQVLNKPKWEELASPIAQLSPGKTWGPWRKNYEYLRIDGGTAASQRGELITSFNDAQKGSAAGGSGISSMLTMPENKVFLISTKAGGMGINLVAANRVILFDSHWNPAVDLQALYRCYRYGQKKPVFAYRLLAEGTMEEKIYSRQVNKSSLAARVVDQNNPLRCFTENELNNLMDNDTWVQCDACDKWRMLSPDADTENLPEKWYCHMNIQDSDRSHCSAEERDQLWYMNFFRSRFAPAKGNEVHCNGDCEDVQASIGKDDSNKDAHTNRDAILKTLLSTAKKGSKRPKFWISKYHFHDALLRDDDQQVTADKNAVPIDNVSGIATKGNSSDVVAGKQAKSGAPDADSSKSKTKPKCRTKKNGTSKPNPAKSKSNQASTPHTLIPRKKSKLPRSHGNSLGSAAAARPKPTPIKVEVQSPRRKQEQLLVVGYLVVVKLRGAAVVIK